MNDYISGHRLEHPHRQHDGSGYVSHDGGSLLEVAGVRARSILDSRGYPTVEVELGFENETVTASAPSGASTGAHEAVELRDGGAAFEGRGVGKATAAVDGEIDSLLRSQAWRNLTELDAALARLDGTVGYSRLGANAILAVSIAAARAFAALAELPLHRWIARETSSVELLPVPHFNVINGGAHAVNGLAFQEFMIAPVSEATEEDAVETGAEIYHRLRDSVSRRFGTAGLGDEGGFAPPVDDPEDVLDLLVEAIEAAGRVAGPTGVMIALDPAANGFHLGNGRYQIRNRELDRDELVAYYDHLIRAYPIRSIEDGFAEDDRDGWRAMHAASSARVQLVGDDLYVTDPQRITDGGVEQLSNAALIKPDQIGTVTQTFAAVAAARAAGMSAMVSHRSGETLDDFIADLAVGTGVGQIKSGAPARGERVAKYNRLVAIERHHADLAFGLTT